MRENLKQRADYTQAFNRDSGRHGWIRLTPAYSRKIVEDILHTSLDKSPYVLDPFCGSGTTALCAMSNNLDAMTTDINPFLVWLAAAKVANYSTNEIDTALRFASSIREQKGLPIDEPKIHNIYRWWAEEIVVWLCLVKGKIDNCSHSLSVKNLLNVAFCRTVIDLSNAAFNHQSMSFKDSAHKKRNVSELEDSFQKNMAIIADGAKEIILGKGDVVLHDATKLDYLLSCPKVDLVVTSPPYANRMSYIRELRPYMYWMGYLGEAREAGELDWKAIGGTWGIATSRLGSWEKQNEYSNFELEHSIAEIKNSDNKNADLLGRYVEKYHDDMYSHFSSLTSLLNSDAEVHYIVGNSTFYGNLVSVEKVYADIMREVGFSDINITPIRKRNSKKELIEFDVSAVYRN